MSEDRDGGCKHCDDLKPGAGVTFSRRHVLLGGAGLVALLLPNGRALAAGQTSIDLGVVAEVSASRTNDLRGRRNITAGTSPAVSRDMGGGAWTTWPSRVTEWVELRWSMPVASDRMEIYWPADGYDVAPPSAARLLYWNGMVFTPVETSERIDTAADRFNALNFAPVTTDRFRLEVTPVAGKSTGVLRWRMSSSGPAPALAPSVYAGVDRCVVHGGRTYLAADARWTARTPGDGLRWSKKSGPGDVAFADPQAVETTAVFSRLGDYELQATGTAGDKASTSTLRVRVVPPPPEQRLDVVYTTPYSIDSPLWSARYKTLIVKWIPQCIAFCERTDLPTGQGGIDNFIEAAKALRGEPHGKHKGYVFSNAWVHQTIESMCLALMIDPQGDAEIQAAQSDIRATLERWIPIVLAAQEPDGYLQTAYTLADRKVWPTRWNPANRADHEGYVAGYFIESAINHYTLTNGRDRRLYDAARKLSDCWVANIGPGKKPWFDGHQEMEQALVRFGRFVNDVEGKGVGDDYIQLARFLLDSREGGAQYDQSHLPPIKQYDAVGHAVRAVYFYSGMADIAAETGDIDYQSAVMSLWDNMVNRKYYVTGGVGSGDTSEGFSIDYALRNDGYCESCSSCGLIFFQYKMNLAYHDAKYADLFEETMYNALLGGLDHAGESFCYTNELVSTDRARWHSCPCCVANIPRTLLMAPTWAYAKGPDALFVNMFVGSRMDVGEVAGARLEMVQKTDYPWKGDVEITVNPSEPRRFALHLRIPNRTTSELYASSPPVAGLTSLKVNGRPAPIREVNGYAVVDRLWKSGDRIDFDLPMAVQTVHGIDKVAEARGQQAFRYGPLIYTVETADQTRLDRPVEATPRPVWKADLLGGAVVLEGQWADGASMQAIPYYLRANRTGLPLRDFPASDLGILFAPGTDAPAEAVASETSRPLPASRVWIRSA